MSPQEYVLDMAHTHTVTNQNILRFSETPCWETIDSFCDFEAHTKDPLHLYSPFQHTIHEMRRLSVHTTHIDQFYEKIGSQV